MRLVASLRHQPVLGDGRLFEQTLALLQNASSFWASASTAPTAAAAAATTTTTTTTTNSLANFGPSPNQTPSNASETGGSLQEFRWPLAHGPAPLLQLCALDLSHNKLKWLINDQFRAIRRVQSIRLDHNRLRFVHQQAFNGLESLRYLNLNSNRLQTIYIEQFQTNYNLLVSVQIVMDFLISLSKI